MYSKSTQTTAVINLKTVSNPDRAEDSGELHFILRGMFWYYEEKLLTNGNSSIIYVIGTNVNSLWI